MDSRTASAAIIGGALLAGLVATGQEPRQEWQLKRSDTPGMVHFRVERWKPGSHWSNSNDVPISRFHGLSSETFERGGKTKFEYVTDAGSLVCTGDFSWHRGTGTYTFQPNPDFMSELRKLGYSTPDENQIFSMALGDVTLKFARGARDAGLHATTGQLIELRIHGVTLDYLRETSEAGYRNLSAQEFIDMKIHGVDTDYLRDLKTFGYDLSPKDIVELKIHGVSSDFIGELKDAGYDLPSRQIVELGIHGIDSRFMRELKDYGLQPQASDMVQLKIHGVSPEFLKGLKDAGYGTLPASQITDLRIHEVDTRFIQEAKSLGYNFTPKELVDLRIQGVDGSYLRRLRNAGFQNLSASQIVRLRVHGVD
jgi:hypothetical protein